MPLVISFGHFLWSIALEAFAEPSFQSFRLSSFGRVRRFWLLGRWDVAYLRFDSDNKNVEINLMKSK